MSLFISACSLHAGEKVSAPDSYLKRSNQYINRDVLENGLICLVKEDHAAPLVSIQFWVGTGSVNEEEYLGGGLSHAIEHMVFKGTPTRKVGEITREIENIGGMINAYTSFDRTVFFVDIPASHWRKAFDVLSDAVLNASFPADEWQRERKVILRELAMNKDDPDRELSKLLWQTAYSVHPYRVPVIGYEDVFKTMQRDDLLEFFKRNYVSDNMIAVIVGDISVAEVQAALKEQFGAVPRRTRTSEVLPQEPAHLALRRARKTGAYQLSRLEWAYHTVALHDADTPALDLLAIIVGQGRSSVLVREIKEKKKLAYSIDAWSFTPKDPGLFGISAIFDPARETALLEALQAEIDRWHKTPFSKEEVAKARRLLMFAILSELQTMHGQAQSMAAGEFYAGNPSFSELYLRRIEEVTPESIMKVAGKYLREENRTLAILAPKSKRQAPEQPAAAAVTNEVRKKILPNGLTLLLKEDHRLPFVYFSVVCNGGLLSENSTNNGITSLMAELMTRGTASRSSEEIARITESLGGGLSAFSGNNSFGLRAQCFTKDADIFMELFADCLLNPTFPEEEIAKQKEVQLAAIAQHTESPMFVAQEALRQMLYPNHPYRFNREGTVESVRRITRDELMAYHERTVVTGNVVLAVFGDLQAEQIIHLVEKYLKKLPAGARPLNEKVELNPQLPQEISKHEPREQTIVLYGFPGVELKDPRMDALTVLQKALSGLSSELVIDIRDERGLAYYAGAFQRPGAATPGMFVIYAGIHEKALAQVQKLILNEISRVTTRGISDEELDRARQQIVAAHQQSLQVSAELALDCALNELYGLGYAYGFSIEKRLQALNTSSIKAAAASILLSSKTAVAIVLPEIMPEALGSIGPSGSEDRSPPPAEKE